MAQQAVLPFYPQTAVLGRSHHVTLRTAAAVVQLLERTERVQEADHLRKAYTSTAAQPGAEPGR